MAKFARECNEEFLQTVSAKLSWSHTVKLMDKLKDDAQRHWYGKEAIENGWSLAVLDHQIDLKLYERQVLSGKVSNFTRTLPAPDSELAQQALKDPYIFDFITAKRGQKEHDIEEQMVANVTNLLLELGTGFAFMGRQYHLVVGKEDFYIDLLSYNTKLRCYVVIELKNDKFKPEFTGQLSFYVAAVDGELAGEHDNPTIGLLLCKEKKRRGGRILAKRHQCAHRSQRVQTGRRAARGVSKILAHARRFAGENLRTRHNCLEDEADAAEAIKTPGHRT